MSETLKVKRERQPTAVTRQVARSAYLKAAECSTSAVKLDYLKRVIQQALSPEGLPEQGTVTVRKLDTYA